MQIKLAQFEPRERAAAASTATFSHTNTVDELLVRGPRASMSTVTGKGTPSSAASLSQRATVWVSTTR
ncbi:unannotated protein [freshwater metagenome]|uniref:Unannotated protein n=1 Tax=freshwater metagenome TaxID=449393 RepID=A0A6J7HM39_9ZZZZ